MGNIKFLADRYQEEKFCETLYAHKEHQYMVAFEIPIPAFAFSDQ
jgi:hypothetical protein